MMRRKRRVRMFEEEGKQGGTWLITFSDLSTLLLVFFVLLVSMSTLDRNQLQSAFQNFDTARKAGSLTLLREGTALSGMDAAMLDLAANLKSVAPGGVRDLNKISGSGNLGKEADFPDSTDEVVWMRKDKEGEFFSVLLGSSFLFGPEGMAVLPGAYPVLDKLADFIRKSEGMVFVDSHTAEAGTSDADPALGRGEALSMAQSQAILNFFLTQCNVNPGRLAMGTYGNLHPLSDAATAAGRKMNGRIEIILEYVAQ